MQDVSKDRNSKKLFEGKKGGFFVKNISERQKDILSIVAKLDISPTMYKNAVEKYKAITQFLIDSGIEADMYPQGSFAFGTVIRPNAKDPLANYDVDVICQVKGNRNSLSPSELRKQIENALTSSNIYGDKLTIYDECFTIEYADINSVGFTIDIVPATDEAYEIKKRLIQNSCYPELIDTAIAIPQYNGSRKYSWLTNNPKGFRSWFETINKPYLDYSGDTYRQYLFEENSAVFASVEDIPIEMERSALQRVIQILKYHRDVYYAKVKDGDNIKPISALINVVVAQISSTYSAECTVFELLEYIIDEFNTYAQQQWLTQKEFSLKYRDHNVLSRIDGKWYIANPANPEDNLADKWNKDNRIPEFFFRWTKVVKSDLIESIHFDEDIQFRAAIENCFGKKSVTDALGDKYSGNVSPRQIVSKTAAKPYNRL